MGLALCFQKPLNISRWPDYSGCIQLCNAWKHAAHLPDSSGRNKSIFREGERKEVNLMLILLDLLVF